MKKQLLFSVATVLLFSTFLFASSPGNDYSKGLGKRLMSDLCKYVNLTDSQKLVIQTSATTYELKLKELEDQPDDANKCQLMNQALHTYKASLDSTLTATQKETLIKKQIQQIKTDTQNNHK